MIKNAMIMDVYAFTDKMILSKIGEAIRRQRLGRDISQRELAASAGVSMSSVAAMERGESVSLKTFIPLLRALHSLHVLDELLKGPEISPIAYAKLLEGKKSRQRASSTKSNNQKQESEW